MSPRKLTPEERNRILTIARSHGARRVLLFGSYATGTAKADSDLDLLVEIEPDRSLLDLIAIKQDIEDALGINVDVVTPAGVSPHLRQEILREAAPL